MRPSVPEGIAAFVATVVLVVAAVTVATRGPSEKASSAVAPAVTQAPPVTQEPSTSTTAPGSNGGAPTAAPSGGGAPSAPVRPGGPAPPKAGHYEYSETDSNGARTSTLDITSHGSGRQTENEDTGSAIDEVAWGPSGKV